MFLKKSFFNFLPRYLFPNTCNFFSTSSDNLISLLTPIKCKYTVYSSTEEEYRNKDPIYILHGLMGASRNWGSIAKALHQKTGRQVWTLDARNHGDSPHTNEMSYPHMAADVRRCILEDAKNESSVIMGHSMGGRTAMYLSLAAPELVSRLIVVDISPVRHSSNLILMRDYLEALLRVKVPGDASPSEARALAGKQLEEVVREKSIRDFLLMSLLVPPAKDGSIWKANVPILAKNFRENIARFPDLPEDLVYNKPTLFIAGKNSDYILPEDSEKIRARFPKANFEFVDGAGHWVHVDQSEKFLKLVVDFVKNS